MCLSNAVDFAPFAPALCKCMGSEDFFFGTVLALFPGPENMFGQRRHPFRIVSGIETEYCLIHPRSPFLRQKDRADNSCCLLGESRA